MSPLATWAMTLGFIGLSLAFALIVNYYLDRWERRMARNRRTDPTPIFRHDEGMRALERIWRKENDDDRSA